MRTIIAGSRTITSYELIPQVAQYSEYPITEVVSGGATGVDSLGEKFAKDNGIDLVIFPANWNKYFKRAGYIRNQKMANYAECLIAIWDGSSKGTKHMIDIMEALGKPVYIYRTDNV